MIMQIVNIPAPVMVQAIDIHKISFTGVEQAPVGMFMYRANNEYFFADVDQNTVRGYAIVEGRRPFWWLWEMAVHPDYRKQGIASGLMDEIETVARETGEHGIELTVRADNDAARSLYLKKKYLDVRPLKNYYQGCNGILMRRDL